MIPRPLPETNPEFRAELSQALADVRFDRLTRLLYSTDASIYQMVPFGVACPRDADEVIAAVEICCRHGVPILPRGAGSSLAGQSVGHALVLDFSRYMDALLDLDPEARQVEVQPGMVLGRLNRRLAPYGLIYGPDPASADRATMGGVLGNNSTGAHSILYGMTADHVLETEVILADGSRTRFAPLEAERWSDRAGHQSLEARIYERLPCLLQEYAGPISERYPRTFRHVAGYNLNLLAGDAAPNLSRLLVGSEGTLAIVTAMRLNLVPRPKETYLALVHYGELRAAMETVPELLETRPAAVEVLDRMLLDLTREKPEYRSLLSFVQGSPEVVLLVEYMGESAAEAQAGIGRLQSRLQRMRHHEAVLVLRRAEDQARVWHARKVGLGILMSIPGDAKPIPFIEDAAVPVEHLAAYVMEMLSYAQEIGVERVAMYAHASAGCIHIRPVINLKRLEGIRQMRLLAERSLELALRYSGTTSGEHGEGLARGEFSERLFGPELTQAFRQVKRLFDPERLLNPGKVVNTPKMDDERLLRFGSDYQTPYAFSQTTLHFSREGGFAAAVEMCNGAGVCRKLNDGVMCPSFQATREEAYSTRGRANTLRAAMMGLLGPDGMASEDLKQVLDLCLACQACKSECPSAVDMAKLKAEFLHHYQQEHGVPLRSRLFANIARLNRLGQPIAPLANALLRGPGRPMLTALGVHPDRQLPALAPEPFSLWFQRHRQASPTRPRSAARQVVFFHDTFTEHNHPEIGKAAIRLLEAAGVEPILLRDKACCGRPAVSKGLLDQARELAAYNLRLLAPYARERIPIVGCEPSCLTMLVDEYREFFPGDLAEQVASQVLPLESFLWQQVQSGEITLPFQARPMKLLYHGHCQQKATFGTEDTLALLGLIPGCEVESIEAGCCGMAGSFGYESEHYELSIQIAELSLAPAIRAAPAEAVICASGTSCREQIAHVTGRQALHPLEVLTQALSPA